VKFVVTGGAGFIGSHLTARLVAEKKQVMVVDNLSTGSLHNLQDIEGQFEFVQGNVCDLELMSDVIGEGDVILHQAARAGVEASLDDPLGTNNHNVTGTLTVLAAAHARRARRVVYAASASVYGDSKVIPATENLPANPLSPYAASKYAGELYCQVFWKAYGLETVSLRYFNVYGPRQNPTAGYAAVIPQFLALMLAGLPPTIYGDGEQTRDFVFVDDVVQANLLAAFSSAAPGHAINIGTGRRYSLNQLVELINQVLDTNLSAKHEPPRTGDIRHSCASIKKARRLLSYAPQTEVAAGLAATAAWLQQREPAG